jgi:hypothetical protein
MVPFNLEIELAGKTVTINVEQLDRLADEEGFIRYDVTEECAGLSFTLMLKIK